MNKKVADNYNSDQVREALTFDSIATCCLSQKLMDIRMPQLSQTYHKIYLGKQGPSQSDLYEKTVPFTQNQYIKNIGNKNIGNKNIGFDQTKQTMDRYQINRDNIRLDEYLNKPKQKQKSLQKSKYKEGKINSTFAKNKNKAQIENKNTKSMSKLTQKDRQKLKQFIESQKLGSRTMPDSRFKYLYGKQCMHNYGGCNTNQIIGGVVYGNYMKTQNVNPHSGGNKPLTYQTHYNALNYGKRQKKMTQDQKLLYLKRAYYKKLGIGQLSQQQKLSKDIDNAYNQLIHGQKNQQLISKQVQQFVKDMHNNTLIVGRPVQQPDQDIDPLRKQNKQLYDGNGHYLIQAEDAKIKKIKCHSFSAAQHKNKKRKQVNRLKKPIEKNRDKQKSLEKQNLGKNINQPNNKKILDQIKQGAINEQTQIQQSVPINTSSNIKGIYHNKQDIHQLKINQAAKPKIQYNPQNYISSQQDYLSLEQLEKKAIQKAATDPQFFNKLLHMGRKNITYIPPKPTNQPNHYNPQSNQKDAYQMQSQRLQFVGGTQQIRAAGIPSRKQ